MINSEIILFWSFSETTLDWGLIYAMQSKNKQMLELQFDLQTNMKRSSSPGGVLCTKKSIKMQVYLKVAAGSTGLGKVNLIHHRATLLAF